jgi:hypothetical protein
MRCLIFAIILVVLLLSLPSFLQFLQNNGCGRRSGMVGHRQIRDDPNHTSYSYHTFDDANPTITYGDRQF